MPVDGDAVEAHDRQPELEHRGGLRRGERALDDERVDLAEGVEPVLRVLDAPAGGDDGEDGARAHGLQRLDGGRHLRGAVRLDGDDDARR